MSTENAAIAMGVTAAYVRHLIHNDKIVAEKVGTSWIIKQKAIANFQRQRKPKNKE